MASILDDDELLPTPWKSARQALMGTMSSRGRAPSATGDYRTRPGAPASPRNVVGGIATNGGATADSNWNSVFAESHKNTQARFGYNALTPPRATVPSLAPTVPTDARSMASTWNALPKAPAASDYLRSAVGTLAQFSEGILGRSVPAGLSFTGGKYQVPGTVGRVDSPSTAFIERLKKDNQVLKSGPRWFEPSTL